MSLIERAVFLMRDANNIKKEYEPVVNLITNTKSVHLSFYDGLTDNLNQFVDLANGRKIIFEYREDSDYPYEAYFEVDKVSFFTLLLDGQKEELEGLIKEREVEVLTNEWITT